MLRLDLKDNYGTVLFTDPEKGVMIRKDVTEVKGETKYELWIETTSSFGMCYATYDSEEERNTAYDYVVHKIKEYLFSKGCLCKEV